MNLVFTILFFSLFSISAIAADEGFRFIDGVCKNAQGVKGYNPSFIGQCSDLRGTTIVKFSFDGIDLSGSLISDANFARSSFRRAKLIQVDFTKTDLSGSVFEEADLTGAKLVSTTLKNVVFADNNFAGANFSSAIADGVSFDFSNLEGVNFASTSLNDASFSDANLNRAQFQQSQLNNSNFMRASLFETNLSGVKLTGARMSGAKTKGLIAMGADFRSVVLSNLDLSDANLSGAFLNNVALINANLSRANLEGSDLRGADLTDVKMDDVKLRGALFSPRTKFSLTKEQALARGMIFKALLEFEGIAHDLDESTLDGWTKCHTSRFNESVPLRGVLDACKGERVLLACRKIGDAKFRLAANGKYDQVFKEIGSGNTGTLENGVQFYYSASFSLGFAHKQARLNRNSCDFGDTDFKNDRLCFHTRGDSLTDGYRCGDLLLNGSTTFERVIFKSE